MAKPLNKMPASVRLYYKNNKPQTKLPLWMFTGSALLFLLLLIVYIAGTKHHQNVVQKMMKVTPGAVYGYGISNNIFSAYSFSRITKDTMYYHKSKEFVYHKDDLKYFLNSDPFLFSNIEEAITSKKYAELVDNNDFFEIEN